MPSGASTLGRSGKSHVAQYGTQPRHKSGNPARGLRTHRGLTGFGDPEDLLINPSMPLNREGSLSQGRRGRSDTVAAPRQYSLRMSTTLIKRSPAANRAMFSL